MSAMAASVDGVAIVATIGWRYSVGASPRGVGYCQPKEKGRPEDIKVRVKGAWDRIGKCGGEMRWIYNIFGV